MPGIHAARGEVIVLLDGDRQNDPADIPKLLAEIERGADLVCGYRANRKDTTFKRIQSRIANFVRSRFTGDGVRDTGCTLEGHAGGMPGGAGAVLRDAPFPPGADQRHGLQAHRSAQPTTGPRVAGVSKYGFGNRAWKATCDMFAVKWLLSRQMQIRVKGEPAARKH